jgi:hypothetical protein
MKKTIFIFGMMFIFLIAVCVAAATAEQCREKAVQHLDTAIQKRVALETKQYAGTWAQVLATRIADVNEITSNVALAKAAALEGIELSDPNNPKKPTVKEYMAQLIADRGKEEKFQKKQLYGTFLQAVEEIVSDPNSLPPESDPNYVEEMTRLEEFRTVCIDLVNEDGGI